MTVTTCVSRNLSITGGALGIARWSTPRVVRDETALSTGDGNYTAQVTLPGKLLVDKELSWTNDSPIPARVLLRVGRAYRDFLVSNPNAVQFRDRWTSRINGKPPVPDTTTVLQSQFGGALDLSSNTVAQPLSGRLWVYQDAHIVEDWLGPVESGATLNVWYRAYLWTPPPWADNANNASPQHNANARSTRLQLMAFPQLDEAVTG